MFCISANPPASQIDLPNFRTNLSSVSLNDHERWWNFLIFISPTVAAQVSVYIEHHRQLSMKIWGVYEVLSLQSPSLLCLGFQQYVILISSNIPRCPSHKNLLLQCTPWVVQTAFVLRWWFLTDHVSVDQMPQGWPSMWAVPRLLYLTHVGDLGIIETKVKIKNQAKRKE